MQIQPLLERLLKQHIREIAPTLSPDQAAELASVAAQSAANGLALLTRSVLARGETVVLEGIGRLAPRQNAWHFEPAAALVELRSLDAPFTVGIEQQVERAAFYLQEAVSLLEQLPTNEELLYPFSSTVAGLEPPGAPQPATVGDLLQWAERRLHRAQRPEPALQIPEAEMMKALDEGSARIAAKMMLTVPANAPVSMLELSVPAYTDIRQAGIRSVGDLLKSVLSAGLAPSTLAEVREILKAVRVESSLERHAIREPGDVDPIT